MGKSTTNDMVEVDIKFFGTFRQFLDPATLAIEVSRDMTIQELRDELNATLKSRASSYDEGLLAVSAIATDDSVLSNSDIIGDARNLSILPPVCGG